MPSNSKPKSPFGNESTFPGDGMQSPKPDGVGRTRRCHYRLIPFEEPLRPLIPEKAADRGGGRTDPVDLCVGIGE